MVPGAFGRKTSGEFCRQKSPPGSAGPERVPAVPRALQAGAAAASGPKTEESGSAAPAAPARNGLRFSGKKVVGGSFVLGFFFPVFLDEVRIGVAELWDLCVAARGGKGPCGYRLSWKPDLRVNIKIYNIQRYYIEHINIRYIYIIII